jgi:hypothetical protein
LRLDARFRFALFGAFALLFVTGGAWYFVHPQALSGSEVWQEVAAYLLMFHGGAAMLGLMLLGALVPLHIQRAWRVQRNRLTGTAMLTFNAALILTSFGLYYAGSEMLRPWMSEIHIAAGFCLPALLVGHIFVGRRSREKRGAWRI